MKLDRVRCQCKSIILLNLDQLGLLTSNYKIHFPTAELHFQRSAKAGSYKNISIYQLFYGITMNNPTLGGKKSGKMKELDRSFVETKHIYFRNVHYGLSIFHMKLHRNIEKLQSHAVDKAWIKPSAYPAWEYLSQVFPLASPSAYP